MKKMIMIRMNTMLVSIKNKNQMKKSRQSQKKRTTKIKRYLEKQQGQKVGGFLDEQSQLETQNNEAVAPRRYIASVVLGLGPGTDDEHEDDKQQQLQQQQQQQQKDNLVDVEATLMDMKLQPKNIGSGNQEFIQQQQDENGQENMQVDVVQ
eukprot:TRINITY_DN4427_c2_g1_i2.p4 TRINITY_DN4427_c2_g1~~TRINITY_DN4427_c2_g1_i2.p4  ORF type:complete len:151 (-),score=24.77 TRINITY_DN4427_c2_g1_i2:246-698(-)